MGVDDLRRADIAFADQGDEALNREFKSLRSGMGGTKSPDWSERGLAGWSVTATRAMGAAGGRAWRSS